MRLVRRSRQTFEVGGARFYSDRAFGSAEAENLVRAAFMANGYCSDTALVAGFITGWDDVGDEDGKPLRFDRKHLPQLPAEVLEQLREQIIARHRKEAEESGDLLGESAAGSSSDAHAPTGEA